MAVRAFDLTEPQSSRLTVVQTAPPRRQDLRRTRRHWMMAGALALILPFVAALLAVGVAH